MFKYDFIYGVFKGIIEVFGSDLIVNGKIVKFYIECDFFVIFWKDIGVEYIVEFIGVFIIIEKVSVYLKGGVKCVIIFVFLVDVFMYVMGVNEKIYDGKVVVIFNVFCIINCLVFFVKVVNDKFGIVEGFMIIVYFYIVIQKIVDGFLVKDWCGGCGVVQNIIFSSIGVVKVVGKVIFEFNGKFIGMVFCVFIFNVFVVDFICCFEKFVSYEIIKVVFKEVFEGEFKGIFGYIEDEIVFFDFNGNVNFFIFDVKVGIFLNDNFVKFVFWYDNEWGYSRCVFDFFFYVVKYDVFY